MWEKQTLVATLTIINAITTLEKQHLLIYDRCLIIPYSLYNLLFLQATFSCEMAKKIFCKYLIIANIDDPYYKHLSVLLMLFYTQSNNIMGPLIGFYSFRNVSIQKVSSTCICISRKCGKN